MTDPLRSEVLALIRWPVRYDKDERGIVDDAHWIVLDLSDATGARDFGEHTDTWGELVADALNAAHAKESGK